MGYARGGTEEKTPSGWTPKYLVAHDYGRSPKNADGVFNPYNGLVFPDGSVRYRNPSDPYGVRAPHAFKLNPYSVGLSYAGGVGSQPTAAALATLKKEYSTIKSKYPGIQILGHGEAFKKYGHGSDMQASKDGRSLIEASWRSHLNDVSTPAPPTIMQAPKPASPLEMPDGDIQPSQAPMGSGYRDQPPRPAPGASPSPVAQPQEKPAQAGAQWINGPYGQGIQWGDGSQSYRGASFGKGVVNGATPMPSVGNGASSGPDWSWGKNLMKMFGGGNG
jgi:hypothetical protein